MKRSAKQLILKAVIVVLVAILFIFLYGFLIGGTPGVWFLIIGFSVLFVSMSLFVTETERKELSKKFVTNIIISIAIVIISLFVYDGINSLQTKQIRTYTSTVMASYGYATGIQVRFLDEKGEEQVADVRDYRIVNNTDYFEEGEKIIVTESKGIFGATIFSVEEAEK